MLTSLYQKRSYERSNRTISLQLFLHQETAIKNIIVSTFHQTQFNVQVERLGSRDDLAFEGLDMATVGAFAGPLGLMVRDEGLSG